MTVDAPARPPDQDDLQALIEEARRRAHRRWRRNWIAFAVVGVVAAGLYALVAGLADPGTKGSDASTPVLPGTVSAAGPFWYMRAVRSMHERLPAGGITMDRRGYTHRHGPNVLFAVRLTEETWVGVDGTMRDRMTAAARFASAGGRAKWAAWGRPQPNFNSWLDRDAIVVGGGRFPPQLWYPWGEGLGPYNLDLGDSLLSYRQLLSLPTTPKAVLDRVTRAEEALMRRQYRAATNVGYETFPGGIGELTDIGGLLASPVPASTRLALLRAAMRLRGARLNLHAHDPLGRAGISVTATDGIAMQRLIFDPATGALLEGPKGVVVAQGAVGSPYALPRGIRPVRAVHGPPEPPALTISPPAGNPKTDFKLTLAPAGSRHSDKAPTLDWIVAGSPSERCFASGFARPLSAAASIRRAGELTYVYRLHPPATGLHAWCPGRYELQVVADYSGRVGRAPDKAAGSPSFSAGTGSSTYFQAR
ncbi:MAG: hypothetical protein ACTHQQ_02010 [Solirubrobacteraceae bacterium]